MTTLIEAARQALEALETCMYPQQKQIQALTSLRQAIEQAEKQEPVTWLAPRYEGGHENLAVVDKKEFGAFPVYTTPRAPHREWVGLSDELIDKTSWDSADYEGFQQGARWAQTKLKEKNHVN